MGAIAKSSRRKGFLIYEEIGKYLVIYGRPLPSNLLISSGGINFVTPTANF
jgi:hypothetical protein